MLITNTYGKGAVQKPLFWFFKVLFCFGSLYDGDFSYDIIAYDIQKLVEYRNIAKWVKISILSIHIKKGNSIRKKRYIKRNTVKERKIPKKEVLINYTIIKQGNTKHEYKVNFSMSAHIHGVFLRLITEKDSMDVMTLLSKELILIRNDRQYPRLQTAHFRKPRYFIYLAA